tara:strand:- start:474 stop:1559 length:1086 start_codon:yes stop_codon:yes gene_type:complete
MSDTPQNLLIRGVNWLGDAIMTLPAITRLREALPKTRLTLLSHEKLAGLWEHTAHFDHVLTFAKGESPFVIGKRLKPEDFDAVLIFPNSLRTAFEAWHAGIPRRIGYAGNWRSPLLTHAIAPRPEAIPMQKRMAIDIEYRLINHLKPQIYPDSAHHIHQYLHLAQHLGASSKPLAPQLERTENAPTFSTVEKPRPYIGLIAGAEYGPAKRWPTEHFIETASQLIDQRQAHIILLGGPQDQETAAEIANSLSAEHHTNLAGQTTLPELVSALAACDAVLANDTGPMHVAAAAGTPVIVPFGSTSPDLTGPGLPNNSHSPNQLLRTTADCSPCFLRKCPIDLRCLKEITPADAVAAVERVLAQ